MADTAEVVAEARVAAAPPVRTVTVASERFGSFEAADKFLMPHLAGTYGVKGGWQMRNLLKRSLGDELRADLEDLDAAL